MIRNANRSQMGIGLVGVLALGLIGLVGTLGCTESPNIAGEGWGQPSQPPAADKAASVEVPGITDPVSAQQEKTPAAGSAETVEQEGGVLKTAGDLFEKAKSGTGATAKGAKDWVQDKLSGAASASGEAADDTMKWATDTFNSLKDKGLTTASDTSEWLTQDWKNMQSWEYKTVAITEATDGNSIDDQLNKLGGQGWECFHVEGTMFYFKKPADSYLRHIPFKDYIKLVPLLQGK